MDAWRASAAEVASLLAATHGNPFALLGPHPVEGGSVWRAFLPDALRVEAMLPGGARALAPREEPGVFEGFLPGTAREACRRLRVHYRDAVWDVDDAYAFGPLLGPLDDHLLIEGTHTRLHERLGAHLVTHEGAAGVRFAVWAPNA
ncbi:MAG: 1,4-alpha-glucan branching enzyme, partial [Rubritepida sp.]|nr:1,4-alpha-glucan branching enzyme [Rubritepida sp.]